MNFRNYKEKQNYFKELFKNRKRLFYSSEKEFDKNGKVIKKGKPYIKELEK